MSGWAILKGKDKRQAFATREAEARRKLEDEREETLARGVARLIVTRYLQAIDVK
jgi:hypothetical protein